MGRQFPTHIIHWPLAPQSMQRHAVWQWRWRWQGRWLHGKGTAEDLDLCHRLCLRLRLGGVPGATRQTHSSRVPEWQMANAPTASFVRRLRSWESLVQFGHDNGIGQGQKGQMEIFPIIAGGGGVNRKGTFNALKCDNTHISFTMPAPCQLFSDSEILWIINN